MKAAPLYDQAGEVQALAGIGRDISDLETAEVRLRDYGLGLEHMLTQTIDAMSNMVEWRDPYTHGHQRRVAELACSIAEEMGLAPDRIQGLRLAAYVHDVGKIAIPAEILSKPTVLTAIERDLVRTHVDISRDILSKVDFPWPVADIAHQHHERMDGSGYPQGLKGDEILLESRILAVADTVEAMSSHRPYRPALGMERALDEIVKNRGRHYDPAVVDACQRVLRRVPSAVGA